MWGNNQPSALDIFHRKKVTPLQKCGSEHSMNSYPSFVSETTELEIERAQSRITYLMEECGKHSQNCHEMKKHFSTMAGRIILLEKRQEHLVNTLRSVGIEI